MAILTIAIVARLALADASTQPRSATRYGPGLRWVATWAAAPQAATHRRPLAVAGLYDQTIREIVLPHVGGSLVTVRFTNVFGSRPIAIAAATIALARARGARLISAPVPLTFAGRRSTILAPGREVTSDAARLAVAPFKPLAVSLFIAGSSGPATVHTVARQMNYLARGDRAGDRGTGAFIGRTASWFFLHEVSVAAPLRVRGTLVALGDSITDGARSSFGANRRWPDDLAERLASASSATTLSVVDAGISGNRVLTGSPCYGPSAESRFADDVEAVAGVRAVILLEGINDIGMSRGTRACTGPPRPITAAELIAGYEHLIEDAHAHGLRIYGGTLLPFAGAAYWTAHGEAIREAVNHWIRTGRAFDGVIDFARAVADPADPERLDPRYDSGDHLHPNDAGDQALADAVNLTRLLRG